MLTYTSLAEKRAGGALVGGGGPRSGALDYSYCLPGLGVGVGLGAEGGGVCSR